MDQRAAAADPPGFRKGTSSRGPSHFTQAAQWHSHFDAIKMMAHARWVGRNARAATAPAGHRRWAAVRSTADPQRGPTAEAYRAAFTMSQLFVAQRPEPIPLTEHQARRKGKDINEIVDVSWLVCCARAANLLLLLDHQPNNHLSCFMTVPPGRQAQGQVRAGCQGRAGEARGPAPRPHQPQQDESQRLGGCLFLCPAVAPAARLAVRCAAQPPGAAVGLSCSL
jgi:hypothetical protein